MFFRVRFSTVFAACLLAVLGIQLGVQVALAEESIIQLRPLTGISTPSTVSSTPTMTTITTTVPSSVMNSNTLKMGNPATTAPGYSTSALSGNNNGSSGYRVSAQAQYMTIPKGTTMFIHMDHPVNSYSTHLGDQVTATLENDVLAPDSGIMVPAGSEVVGQVSQAQPSRKLGRHGEIEIQFHTIRMPNGNTIPLRAHVVTQDKTGILKGNSYTRDVVNGVGVTAGGAAIGTTAGLATGALMGVAGTGAVVGLAVGALAGGAYAINRSGKDVVLPAGTRMSIVVDQNLGVN